MAAGNFCRLLFLCTGVHVSLERFFLLTGIALIIGDAQLEENGMDKRIRDRIKRIEKLELDLLSDEQLSDEKKEIMMLIEMVQQELLRRIIIIAALIVSLSASVIGLLSYPSAPMLFVVLICILLFVMANVQYIQKYRGLNDLHKASDILYKIS